MLVHQLVEMQASKRPNIGYISSNGVTTSYGDFALQVSRLAGYLNEIGVQKGDRVLIAVPNTIEFFLSFFASLTIGAIAVPLSHKSPPNKLRFILDDCRPVVAITNLHPDQVIGSDQNHALKEIVLCTGNSSGNLNGHARVSDFRSVIKADAFSKLPRIIDLDPAMIIYTSGSTGHPKGILCSHLNITSAAASIVDYLGMHSGDKVIQMLPPFFDYGLYQAILTARVGASLALLEDAVFPDQILTVIKNQGITGIPLVPSIAAILLNFLRAQEISRSVEFSCAEVRYISSTGASFHPKYIAGLRAHFPRARIYSMYGLSECKRVTYLDPNLVDAKPYCVGKPMKNVEAWVVDEKGEPVPPETQGILVVRGSNVALGYWNDPKLTSSVFRTGPYGERLLFTNDVFRQDKDGYLFFLGRNDELIKSGAFLISLKEISDLILSVNGVLEVAVLPIRDEELEFVIKAFVVLEAGFSVTEAELKRQIRLKVETSLKVPREIVFLASLPKNANQKVDRNRLIAYLDS